jgi:hypothetical protein
MYRIIWGVLFFGCANKELLSDIDSLQESLEAINSDTDVLKIEIKR